MGNTIREEATNAYNAGRYFESEEILCSLIGHPNGGGLNDKVNADLWLDYGLVLTELGRFQEAHQFLKRSLELYEQLLGRESVDYANALRALGKLCCEIEQEDDGRTYLLEALQVMRNTHRCPARATARVLADVADAERKYNKRGAIQYFEEALSMYAQVGESSGEYAEALENRSNICLLEGKLDEAEAGFRKSYAMREKCLRADHPHMAYSLLNLAQCALIKDAAVEDQLKKALDIASVAWGPMNPRLAVFHIGLGAHYRTVGRIGESANCFERVVSIRESAFGVRSHSLMYVFYALAAVYGKLRRTTEAQVLRARSEALMKAKLAESKEPDANLMARLADLLFCEQRFEEALYFFELAEQTACSLHGSHSLKAAEMMFLRAIAIRKSGGELDRAKALLRTALQIQKKTLGKNHPDVAKTLTSLALCLNAEGLNHIAEVLQEQVRAINFAVGNQHSRLAAMQAKYNQMRDLQGERHPGVVQYLRILSDAYRHDGFLKEAAALEEQYYKVREEETASDRVELARELAIRAQTIIPGVNLLKKPWVIPTTADGEQEHAISLLQRAASIYSQTAGSTHQSERISTLVDLVVAYASCGRLAQAESTAIDAVTLAEASTDPRHWSLRTPLEKLGIVLELQDKEADAAAIRDRLTSLSAATSREVEEYLRPIRERAQSVFRLMRELEAIHWQPQGSQTND